MLKFGTDGIRGTSAQLNETLAYKVGLALSTLMGNGKYLVGRDTRVGGDALSDAITCGICAGGGECIDLGVVTTPCVSMLTVLLEMRCGVMVTASHNAPEYNGIKIFGSDGLKLGRIEEKQIESYVLFAKPRGRKMRCTKLLSGAEIYISEMVRSVGRLDGVQVTLDVAHGSACSIAKKAFSLAGASVKVRNNLPDGSRINVGCGALFPSAIKNAELGFAFDGDADRVTVAHKKSILDGDSVLYTLSENIELKDQTIVGTVMSNLALERALKRSGKRLVRTDVGDKYVSAVMHENGYTLGGEQSGHYIISPYKTGDGIFCALKLAEIYLRDGFKILDTVPQKNVSFYADRDVTGMDGVNELIDYYSLKGVRLVVRMSGTEPKVRVMAESEDEAIVERALKDFSALLGEKSRKS